LAIIAERAARRIPPLPFMAAPLVLVALPLVLPTFRRVALFYVLVGLAAAVLAIGDATPLFGWYTRLPFIGATVRDHFRLFWVTGFCLCMLTALSVEVLQRGVPRIALLMVLVPAGVLVAYAPG